MKSIYNYIYTLEKLRSTSSEIKLICNLFQIEKPLSQLFLYARARKYILSYLYGSMVG